MSKTCVQDNLFGRVRQYDNAGAGGVAKSDGGEHAPRAFRPSLQPSQQNPRRHRLPVQRVEVLHLCSC